MTLAPGRTAHHAPADVLLGHALRGVDCELVVTGHPAAPLPVDDWVRPADRDDQALLDLCAGPTLDVGCGPGRLVAALVQRGVTALGVDISAVAVEQAIARGAPALRRDVFGPLPREGSWGTTLLADGNLGIGGEPLALLTRLRRVLAPGGRVVAEVAGPGVATRSVRAHLRCGPTRSAEFGWAVVGVDDLPDLARTAGFCCCHVQQSGERWFVVLREGW